MNKMRKDELAGITDVDQQFILRIPEAAAENLRRELQSGSSSLKDKLSLEIHPESRQGRLIYDGQMFNARLHDLPCIIESYKTTDKKLFYKTADISQILICKTEFEEDSVVDDSSDTAAKKKDKEKKFMWNHGLCPPFKNVRHRRFRKIVPKKNPEQPDIEKELKRLFAEDKSAVDFKYEIIMEADEAHQDDTKKSTTANSGKNKSAGASKTPVKSASNESAKKTSAAGGNKSTAGEKNSRDVFSTNQRKDVSSLVQSESQQFVEESFEMDDVIDEQGMFGIISSDEDDDNDADAPAVNGEESMDAAGGGMGFEATNRDESGQNLFAEDSNQGNDPMDLLEGLTSEFGVRYEGLKKRLAEIQDQKSAKESELQAADDRADDYDDVDSSDLKAELQSELEKLIEEERACTQEMAMVSSMMD